MSVPIDPTDTPRVAAPARLASLDVFRGLTIAAMVLVNNPGPGGAYAPLRHAEWHGWTPTDLVFPFFLFIVGVAIPFSLGRRGEDASRGALLGRIWTRALALFMLGQLLTASNLPLPWRGLPPDGFLFTKAFRFVGFVGVLAAIVALLVPWRSKRLATWMPVAIALLFYGYAIAMHFVRARAIANGWDPAKFGGSWDVVNGVRTLTGGGVFNPDRLRIPSVLGRIGLCYGVAATIALFAGWRTLLTAAVLLCGVYAALMLSVGFPGEPRGSLTREHNLAHSIDQWLLVRGTHDHAYANYADPEGVLSTLPAIAGTLIGVLCGLWLRSSRSAVERCAGLLAMALPTILLGAAIDGRLMPINKSLWTPSYAVFSTGLAMLGLGFIFWACDVHGRRAWAWPLKVYGTNAIAAFVASTLVVRIGRWIVVTDPHRGDRVGGLAFIHRRLIGGLAQSDQWLQAHAPTFAGINSPQNQSLVCAAFVVLIIFAVTWLLYACRIFVKV